ncbi:winged helix-turn-helix domain-containing protein, partial [Synechococcus sp. BA-132 BA5]|uniref:winged helix-turn-helix domain-containing protein n=1 Tax=Synechococcus sp. BA-132 BA5 TaxID=3110252 RepID=UPI002B1F1BFB
ELARGPGSDTDSRSMDVQVSRLRRLIEPEPARPRYVQTVWGYDILGADVLLAGDSADVLIADGSDQCVYDLRFVFDDGEVLEDYGVDICELAEYTLTD